MQGSARNFGRGRTSQPQQHGHVSPQLGPQLAPPPAPWDGLQAAAAHTNAHHAYAHAHAHGYAAYQAGPSHYQDINAMLAQLHSERVNAGARPRWEEADDDDDDDL